MDQLNLSQLVELAVAGQREGSGVGVAGLCVGRVWRRWEGNGFPWAVGFWRGDQLPTVGDEGQGERDTRLGDE